MAFSARHAYSDKDRNLAKKFQGSNNHMLIGSKHSSAVIEFNKTQPALSSDQENPQLHVRTGIG